MAINSVYKTKLVKIRRGDSGPVWKIGVERNEDNTLRDLTNFTCVIYHPKTQIFRTIVETDLNNERFIIQMIPGETELMTLGDQVVAIEIENQSIFFRKEIWGLLNLECELYGAKFVDLPVVEFGFTKFAPTITNSL